MTDEDARDMHALALGTARDTPFAQEERLYGAALAPERGGGSEPAPPAASGWRESLRPHIMGALKLELHDHQKAHALTEAVMRNLAAAPPPPVPAQAESGEVCPIGMLPEHRSLCSNASCRHCLADRLANCSDRIRELEGENAGLRELYDGNTKFLAALAKGESERADSLTRAALSAALGGKE